MGSYRTVFLLVLAVGCGIGAGVFGFIYDGLAPTALFIAFPFVVAMLFISAVYDVVHEQTSETEATASVAHLNRLASAKPTAGSQRPKAA